VEGINDFDAGEVFVRSRIWVGGIALKFKGLGGGIVGMFTHQRLMEADYHFFFGNTHFFKVFIKFNGEQALILRALCARKISALNKKCTSGMLPR
jgi:hypothetical protein